MICIIPGIRKKSRKKKKASLVCEECGVSNGKFDKEITKHHIKPRSEGGSNRKYNIKYLCLACHRKTHNQKEIK